MGYDLPTGKKGNVPDSKNIYKKYIPMVDGEEQQFISNAIGQGEVLMTPFN
jgi:penicillin-binding protein 2